MDKRLFGFIAAGGAATLVNYGFFLFLLSTSVHHTPAASFGYVSGIAVSYLINRFVVFRESKKSSFVRYSIAYLGALVIQLLLLNALVSFGIGAEVANAIAIAIVVVVNFFVVRKFAF